MKVTIRKYPDWVGPYQLVEKLCFWTKKDGEYPQWVFNLGDKLAHSRIGGYISNAAEAYLQFHHDRRVQVRIDAHDVWSMDWPNSLEGDLLKQAHKEIKEAEAEIQLLNRDLYLANEMHLVNMEQGE